MPVENWSQSGMPPVEYDVLDRWVIPHSKDAERRTEYIWLRGELPHLGKVINGETGRETFVEKYINGHERIKKEFYNLPYYHPLYEAPDQKPNPIQIFPKLVSVQHAA